MSFANKISPWTFGSKWKLQTRTKPIETICFQTYEKQITSPPPLPSHLLMLLYIYIFFFFFTKICFPSKNNAQKNIERGKGAANVRYISLDWKEMNIFLSCLNGFVYDLKPAAHVKERAEQTRGGGRGALETCLGIWVPPRVWNPDPV